MNDEDAFQAWLDEHPDDHTARMVFADWPEERDDPRAAGYRELGRRQLRLASCDGDHSYCWWSNGKYAAWCNHRHYNLLPQDWYERAAFVMGRSQRVHLDGHSRRELEDAAALAHSASSVGVAA